MVAGYCNENKLGNMLELREQWHVLWVFPPHISVHSVLRTEFHEQVTSLIDRLPHPVVNLTRLEVLDQVDGCWSS